jgi:hypothetical protein
MRGKTMERTRGDRRAETARENDDSDIIEAAEDEARGAGEHQQGAGGGNLQSDIGTQAEQERAADPDRHESVTKGDHIAHGHGETPRHPATKVVTERD